MYGALFSDSCEFGTVLADLENTRQYINVVSLTRTV